MFTRTYWTRLGPRLTQLEGVPLAEPNVAHNFAMLKQFFADQLAQDTPFAADRADFAES